MRDHRDVVRRGERNDAARLGEPAHPRDVRLQDVGALLLQELPEAVAGVLVLAARHHRRAHGTLHVGVALVVVRRQEPAWPTMRAHARVRRRLGCVLLGELTHSSSHLTPAGTSAAMRRASSIV